MDEFTKILDESIRALLKLCGVVTKLVKIKLKSLHQLHQDVFLLSRKKYQIHVYAVAKKQNTWLSGAELINLEFNSKLNLKQIQKNGILNVVFFILAILLLKTHSFKLK